MSPLDLFLSGAVALPAAWGLWRGIVSGVTGPAALVVAGVAAVTGCVPVGRVLLGPQPLAPVAGFIGLFVAGYLAVRLVGLLVRKLAAAAGLAWADHLGGGLVGAALGAVVGAWVAAVAAAALPGPPAFVRRSVLLPQARVLACATGLDCQRLRPGATPSSS